MFWFPRRISHRGLLAVVLGGATVTAAGAATYHRLTVSQSTGSGGATNFVQSATSSSALQGNVGTADTTYGTPFGVFGVYNTAASTFGIGVLGASSTGYGIAGESLSNSQPSILAYPGGNGPGLEATTIASSTNPAILSVSKGSGDGVDGVSTIGSGVYALNNATGDSVNDGVQVGLYAASTVGNAIYAKAANSVGAFFANASDYYTMVIQNQGQGPILIAQSPSCTCLTLDGSGDLVVNGTITDENGTFARTRNPSSDLVTYGAETTQPTVEDVGRAQLTGGSGTVALAADFRQTIEGTADYLIFLTPHGDTNGLFVASQNANGFVVRESHGGRSTIAFDYRIVAQRYGMKTGRLPHYAALHPEARSRGVRLDGEPPDTGISNNPPAMRHPNVPAIVGMPTRSMLAH